MTLPQLRKRTSVWQTRLNLREWTLIVAWGREDEMVGLAGCCQWNAEELHAVIHINRRDPTPEGTLVHELLHILLDGHLEEVPAYDVHRERAINRMTAALLPPD